MRGELEGGGFVGGGSPAIRSITDLAGARSAKRLVKGEGSTARLVPSYANASAAPPRPFRRASDGVSERASTARTAESNTSSSTKLMSARSRHSLEEKKTIKF